MGETAVEATANTMMIVIAPTALKMLVLPLTTEMVGKLINVVMMI